MMLASHLVQVKVQSKEYRKEPVMALKRDLVMAVVLDCNRLCLGHRGILLDNTADTSPRRMAMHHNPVDRNQHKEDTSVVDQHRNKPPGTCRSSRCTPWASAMELGLAGLSATVLGLVMAVAMGVPSDLVTVREKAHRLV